MGFASDEWAAQREVPRSEAEEARGLAVPAQSEAIRSNQKHEDWPYLCKRRRGGGSHAISFLVGGVAEPGEGRGGGGTVGAQSLARAEAVVRLVWVGQR